MRGRLAGDAADEEPRIKKEKYGKIDREESMQMLLVLINEVKAVRDALAKDC